MHIDPVIHYVHLHVCFLGIPRSHNMFYRKRRFLERAEHTIIRVYVHTLYIPLCNVLMCDHILCLVV